jgi:predicted CoA-substrate-specific enzyme activase
MQDIDWNGLTRKASLLGVDVGAIYLKAAAIGPRGELVWSLHRPHQGTPLALVERLEQQCRLKKIPFGITGGLKETTDKQPLDPVLCLHAAARHLYPSASNILEVGATHYCLVRLNRSGDIHSIQTNPICASGTGSFLDAQAERMGLDYDAIESAGIEQEPPGIATRCAVFAKSDLIHRQQEGFDIPALWSGLCRGLAEGLLHALTHGSPIRGKLLLCGGVALNRTFAAWLQSLFGANGNGVSLKIAAQPELTAAVGAALLGRNGNGSPRAPIKVTAPAIRKRRPALVLERSRPVRYRPLSYRIDHLQNEIAVHRLPQGPQKDSPLFLGIDIGSTSTKLAFVDATGNLLLDVYRRTQSDPIQATRHLLSAAQAFFRQSEWHPVVAGAGTTGSGRKLIGKIIGADLIISEISAHVAGAVRIDPEVQTLFEIGGQDAKYMRIHNGRIVDANMNYVCAAGTGSFIEELCSKLGYRVEELGEELLGVEPPYINSRCTVFMEQDIHTLLQERVPRREAAGAIIYSVIENYLHRVVGKRPVNGPRVMFQGATARNIALSAAIEHLLDREVVVSPYPHAMGAYGVALLAHSSMSSGPSKFKGLDLASRRIDIEKETCSGCRNRCELTRAVIEGEKKQPLWGMKCGRDETSGTHKKLATYEVFQQRQKMVRRGSAAAKRSSSGKRIVMPLALSAYSLGPFWAEFFSRIGVDLVLGPPTDESVIQSGRQVSGTEFCLPVKTALGHFAQCIEKYPADPLFVPHLLSDYNIEGLTQTRFCPYLEVLPSLIRPMAVKKNKADARIIAPVINLRLPDSKNAQALVDSLRPLVRLRQRVAVQALQHAHRVRRHLQAEIEAAGRARWMSTRSSGRPVVVIIGRPYNTLDPFLSHRLPYEIAAAGLDVLPMDALAFRPELLEGYFRNLFWSESQKIVSALIQIARTEGLYPVCLSNFGCGPDSFILSYAEDIMGDKPLLILELDEHGSSGGYQTRLEAFLEVIRADHSTRRKSPPAVPWQPPTEAPTPGDIKKRRLYVPHLHPTGSRLLAAALRGEGFNALMLPIEDSEAFTEGRKWTRGTECLPAPLTLGSILRCAAVDRENGEDPNSSLAFFMPTSDGPCRFGQYCALDRMALNKIGCRDLPILSPRSENAYCGIDQKVFEYILLADILFKMRCRIKPREKTRGDAEETLERLMQQAEGQIEQRCIRLRNFLPEAVSAFKRIPVETTPRLLVGVVGEIYVRCHAYANNQLFDTIEQLGGEVWVAPATEWIMYTAWMERYRLQRSGMSLWQAARLALRWQYMHRKEHAAYRLAAPLLADRGEPPLDEIIAKGRRFIPPDFEGESILTLGRALLFKRDGARLIINCAPFGCMHGNITATIFNQAAEEFDAPIVNIAYDGVGNANSIVETFMQAAWRNLKSDLGAF